ncbi:adenylyltransferase and sulfurtransferase MOCS3 isoform X1 [Harpegnathos saltator]|nr:adenylyltransferase and sulfurtransferase MOCS3 isoform X1 [Harpegnathos saltator]XP_025152984.1 adenylyltransferase and sulfurtransferase MOCS3 isoform X1 [Harpegnathos saltator]XP_025152989.1 adenylyltransferase and sulfurtransferase MOCS3 isoform X1 [Harpegnathos saltator]XP_025152991.1 adenylyltransferase and sulfurtransferase MOCS3 isoform X1 [Harpegnathos saltator]XP_025152993.1 adenylyltransferase and sulfurtransferase MOCS3 isoform X1 [Harpegnathos saltator]XP_025152998.1 adenylyltr
MSIGKNEDDLKKIIAELRATLNEKEAELADLQRKKQIVQEYGLSNDEILRYSRQLFLREINVQGQKKIKDSSVLIVGVGGLGCPAALYLACSGVGHIGIVDYDNIELNNLHRQILFMEASIGTAKVTAAAETINRLNSNVKVTPYKIQLDSKNALDIIKNYDIVLDATDNVATRYLLNDACVLSGKPLVSGSALRFEGHLTVFNYNGPCYRCIFPEPPPPETVTNCGDGGILGAAVGIIGVLQALEALKIMLELPDVTSERMLLFDAMETKFMNVRLRSKNTNCVVCGEHPVIRELIDYEEFCGAKANDKEPNLKLLKKEERITVEEYNRIAKDHLQLHVLIDVRSPEEYQICRLQDSINIPFTEINKEHNLQQIRDSVKKVQEKQPIVNLYLLCRRGNDSQKAVQCLKKTFTENTLNIRDIIGGIHAWSNEIDPNFPKY